MSDEDSSESDERSRSSRNSNPAAAATDDTTDQNPKPKRLYHYQLGAPALIYHANKSDHEWTPYRMPTSRLPADSANSLYDKLREQNRVKTRWNYVDTMDGEDVVDDLLVPYDYFKTKGGNVLYEDVFDEQETPEYMAREQQAYRLAMLTLEDSTRLGPHRQMVADYRKYESPYLPMNLGTPERSTLRVDGGEKIPRFKESEFARGQEFQLQHDITSDASYLAPFDRDTLRHVTDYDKLGFQKPAPEQPKRLNQGNALLVCACPCPVCASTSSNQSMVLFHPKGHSLERLCASNLITPRGPNNAGSLGLDKRNRISKYQVLELANEYANEVDLNDTILEIRQCSLWKPDDSQLVLAVRTGTHVSVVTVDCELPPTVKRHPAFSETLCWGCYVVKERERMDFRSISRAVPSLQAVSLTSHPRFGNACTPSRFAFACHSMGDEPEIRNRVYLCNTWNGHDVTTRRHDISNLRKISLVDFASSNPMCLWSAASSYVRPTVAAGVAAKMIRQTRGAFGLGTSLFSIDLRTNNATFQWSPSAEEFSVEGVYSLSGIMTDWNRDNTIWVTSASAGKTWEIDGRMPARSITCWSLTSACDRYKGITVPKNGFHGEPSLLVPTRDVFQTDKPWVYGDAPFVKVDTDYGVNGLHLYQRPLRGPRFQTESLESIATPGIDATDYTSIATSSYCSLPEVDIDTFVCGVVSLRLSLDKFVAESEKVWDQYYETNSSVLCNLTINSTGDIFSNCMLENSAEWKTDPTSRFDNLPVGTRAIGIPEEIDGRRKPFAKDQKPTCGMNLGLFVTNDYPLSRRSAISAKAPKGKQNVITIWPSRRKRRFDDSDEVVEIVPDHKSSGIALASENGEEHPMLQNGEKLSIPVKLTKHTGKKITFYKNKDKTNHDDSDVDSTTSSHSQAPRVSDVTALTINDALASLDNAIQSENESSSDSSDDNSDI